MGDPKKQVNRYSTPRHPWERDRIDEEKVLTYEYGLKNKKEIWKQASFIKNIKTHVKRLNGLVGTQADLEKDQLFNKLIAYGLLKEGQSLDEALELTTKDIMERRLQTQCVRQGLARTMMQARQFIVHGHIKVNGKKITAPGFLVTTESQFAIEFIPNSAFSDPEHPERTIPVEVTPAESADESENLADKDAAKKLGVDADESVPEDTEVSEDAVPEIEDDVDTVALDAEDAEVKE